MPMHNFTDPNAPSGGNGNNGGNAGGNSGMPPFPFPLTSMGNNTPTDDFNIEDFCTNYNTRFATTGKAQFRDSVVQQTMSVLIAKNKPNALLVGPAGVGKTKIVEDIAFRLATNDPVLPDQLRGYTIWELPLANIVSGSTLVGQLEEKAKFIIDYFTDVNNKAILFIDEIHMLTQDSQTYEKIAQILKPALARGDIHCIGATTTQEARTLYNDPAFNRRFTRIIVDELTKEQTLDVLKTVRGSLLMHYLQNSSLVPTVDDSVLEQVIVYSDQYKTVGSHRPDSAITLLDRAIGDAIVQRKVQEDMLKSDPVLLQALQANTQIPVTANMLKTVALKLATGNSQKDALDVDNLITNLSRIKGQDSIKDDIIKLVKKHDSDLYPKKKPSSAIFAGPSGVGKTETVKIIARELTGSDPIILNMTEFTDASTVNRIIGAPPGYSGCDDNTELPFDCLESNPYKVILLDEFEKCHSTVQGLFMSALEEGCIKTNRGTEIDFSKAMIIATTNAGCTNTSKSLALVNISTCTKAEAIKKLSGSMKEELLNRFKMHIMFNPLGKDIYREIVVDNYTREYNRLLIEQPSVAKNLPTAIPDDKLDEIVETTYVEAFGARPAEEAVRDYIEDALL